MNRSSRWSPSRGSCRTAQRRWDPGHWYSLIALEVAHSAKLLGAGRDKKTDNIDFGAGIILNKKVGDIVKKDEVVMELYYNDALENKLNDAINIAKNSFEISDNEVQKPKLIY